MSPCRPTSAFILLAFMVLMTQVCPGQGMKPTGEEGNRGDGLEKLDDGDFSLGETLLNLFVPRGVKDTWRLKRFLRSEKFQYLKISRGDLRAVDEIYRRALEITNGDITEALFICVLSTMEHRTVGVRFPLLHFPVYVPLTSETDSLFRVRISRLPSKIYLDTPPGEFGDKDKLQHFFGSAFLSYSSRSRRLSSFAGDFVEWGEEAFIIDGLRDIRDLRANHQGREFGLAIGRDADVQPSDFLRIQLVLSGSRTEW
jgi:hypothetical protein